MGGTAVKVAEPRDPEWDPPAHCSEVKQGEGDGLVRLRG